LTSPVTAPVPAGGRAAAGYNSGGRVDAVTALVGAPAAALDPVLAPLGLERQALDGVAPDLHPVCVELWHVTDGRAELGGIDQHVWTEQVGGAAAGFTGAGLGAFLGAGAGVAAGTQAGGRVGARFGELGRWWGALVGSTVGGALGAMGGALDGAARMSALSGQAARRMSESLSRTIGSYREILIDVPNVTRAGAGSSEPRHRFVLAMYADNPVAIAGDRALGTGYGKRLAAIQSEPGRTYQLTADCQVLLRASVDADHDGELGACVARDRFGWLWRQPLLGRRSDGRLMVSRLDRTFDQPGLSVAAVSARLEVGPGCAPGLPSGNYQAGAAGDGPFGALRVAGAMVRLTFPFELAAGGGDP
jgi:hypothetical protein